LAAYPSRSEADEAIIASLLGKGYGDDVIFSVFEKYPTTGKYKEKEGRRHQYLSRSIANAKRFVEKRVGDSPFIHSSHTSTMNTFYKGKRVNIPIPSSVLG
ncbi:hypothetical protein MYX76_19050, partial [Desulfobacterota bacterium AH_259_B03_O07]|nr:hypothetical protein [Desulfobacterota bacterium AH_259_B03_O07]